ncbi:alpha-N-acetylglucosaminidase [Brachybacterium sp. FME24]|uniref:alpha-N-acetylglucosaminidase n=1 Tax=Brachybacterium sp. FME24 TaxID=2742605 RepID=UPI0018681990|nr:alpha-N-acetylglucosaminidase [Brachybacterium sp. FME24]
MNPEPTDQFDGVRDLVRRRAPGLVGRLRISPVPAAGSRSSRPDGASEISGASSVEHVTVSAADDELVLEASSPSAACIGLARALEDFYDADLSWDGPPVIDARAPLPEMPPQRFETSLRTRYHLNPVAFGYTAAFWDWAQWERHIDWMALHGVTTPLNLVGHETVLVRMLRDLGLEREDAARFVGGNAFLPWTTMGITHDLGAPLTDEALASRARLGRRITERERELGMTVVLPGFGGQLPEALVGSDRTIEWQGWQNSLADPGDPLFAEAAASLHRHQRELLGTDHHYAVDPYIESLPPTTSPDDLAAHAGAIYAAMHDADPEAVWILQGWPFHYRASYWTPERVRSLLSRIPEDRLVLLDLWAEHAPMWHSTGSMYGRRWLWCLAHNFGGRFGMFGDLASLDADLADLRQAAAEGTRGRLEGFGITSEALDDNAVVYELATRALWSPMPSLPRWREDAVARRYGARTPAALEAWDLFSRTLYGPGRTRSTPSPLIARPWSRDLPFATQRLAGEALPEAGGPPSANLDAENDEEMLRALPALARAVHDLIPLLRHPEHTDALEHDAAQITIHVAAQSARAPLRAMVAAADAGDGARVHQEAGTLEDLILGVERVAATRPELLVGRWIADARAGAGSDPELADALERDARSLISVWGEQTSGLHDYSARHWSGSLSDLHLTRWRAWANWLALATEDPNSTASRDPEPLRGSIRRIEEDWRESTTPYPVTTRGNLADQIEQLLDLAEHELPRLVPDDSSRG